MDILKTGFEWSVLEWETPTKLDKLTSDSSFPLKSYYDKKITFDEYKILVKNCEVERFILPNKPDMFLTYRMYGLVPYNLSPIQQGIQFGHAVVEYGQLSNDIQPFNLIYNKWANNDKTFIILNGGTTNENKDRLGTMQNYSQTLKDNGVLFAEFREPDLNDTLTAIVFLVDERVYNKELYFDFDLIEDAAPYATYTKRYNEWLKFIGGEKNLFLRNFLPNFKLA